MQRLSSGLRINSAKDDAAGLAISDRMTSQIRGLNQAARNSNDGISLAQTAEGALQESTNILQRMRELAVQSANDTNSASDRSSLQAEVGQLISEMDRIATTTQFNGKNLLDGTLQNAVFHVGANANQTISVGIDSARASALGSVVNDAGVTSQTITATATNVTAADTTYLGVEEGAGSTGSNIQINGTDIVASTTYGTDSAAGLTSGSAYALSEAINASNVPGVHATADNTQVFSNTTNGYFLEVNVDVASADTLIYALEINGEQVYSQTFAADTNVSIDDIVANINDKSTETGVVATKDGNGDLQLQAADGRDIIIEEDFNVTDAAGATTNTASSVFSTGYAQDTADTLGVYDATFRGQVTLQSSENISLNTGGDILGFGTDSVLSVDTTESIASVDISTQTGANDAILAVDAALSAIDSSRGDLGAVQNRFESTIANLSNVAENLSAARSRILDADIAQETSAMTKNNILQQAGVSILAQANQAPQLALSLLG
jgi:flagellin